jgi:hypothetical protein
VSHSGYLLGRRRSINVQLSIAKNQALSYLQVIVVALFDNIYGGQWRDSRSDAMNEDQVISSANLATSTGLTQ